MGWEPPAGMWDEWAEKYKSYGDYYIGYAQGVEEAAGGPCSDTPAYGSYDDYNDGYKKGLADGASGNVRDPDQLMMDPPTDEEMQHRMEEAQREQESDENQEVMWGDGSVSTKSEHEAQEARETLERLTGFEMPEPVEGGGEESGGGDAPAVVAP